MVKIGKKKLKLRSGKIVTFKSSAARERFERVAEAINHGWKPTGKKAKKLVKGKKTVKAKARPKKAAKKTVRRKSKK